MEDKYVIIGHASHTTVRYLIQKEGKKEYFGIRFTNFLKNTNHA
jgi:hypothetical protein